MKAIYQKQNIGNAGEYYVAARLSALDFTASITLGRAERYDILALNHNGRTFKISVKTRFFGKSTGFTLSEKDEKDPADDFFYVFVKLYAFEQEPDFWVIPSKIVSAIISDSHKKWLETPARNSKPHNDNSMRMLPVIVTKGDVPYYPVDWEETLKTYYKNFDPLYQNNL